MKETILHTMWELQLFPSSNWISTSDQIIQILEFGKVNTDFGPDILNSTILVDDEILTGDIEIHWKGKHWHEHNHESDSSYNRVILHVCWEKPLPIQLQSKELIQAIALSQQVSPNSLNLFQQLITSKQNAYCKQFKTAPTNNQVYTLLLKQFNFVQIQQIQVYHQLWKQGYSIPHIRFIMWVEAMGRGANKGYWKKWATKFPFDSILAADLDLELLKSEILESEHKKGSYYSIPEFKGKPQRARAGRRISDILSHISNLIIQQPKFFMDLNIESSIQNISKYGQQHIKHTVIPNDLLLNGIITGDQEVLSKVNQYYKTLKKEENKYSSSSYLNIENKNGLDSKLIMHQEKYFCSILNCKNCIIFKYWLMNRP